MEMGDENDHLREQIDQTDDQTAQMTTERIIVDEQRIAKGRKSEFEKLQLFAFSLLSQLLDAFFPVV